MVTGGMIKSYYQEYMEWKIHFSSNFYIFISDLIDSIEKYTHELRYMIHEQQLS